MFGWVFTTKKTVRGNEKEPFYFSDIFSFGLLFPELFFPQPFFPAIFSPIFFPRLFFPDTVDIQIINISNLFYSRYTKCIVCYHQPFLAVLTFGGLPPPLLRAFSLKTPTRGLCPLDPLPLISEHVRLGI